MFFKPSFYWAKIVVMRFGPRISQKLSNFFTTSSISVALPFVFTLENSKSVHQLEVFIGFLPRVNRFIHSSMIFQSSMLIFVIVTVYFTPVAKRKKYLSCRQTVFVSYGRFDLRSCQIKLILCFDFFAFVLRQCLFLWGQLGDLGWKYTILCSIYCAYYLFKYGVFHLQHVFILYFLRNNDS